MKKAFTLIELIIAIVIIGVLSAVAIPKFGGMVDNSKISAEIATANSVQTIVNSAHSEWIINDCNFTWGNKKSRDDLNSYGYPKNLGDGDEKNVSLNWILNDSNYAKFIRVSGNNDDEVQYFEGPASNEDDNGVDKDKQDKPDIGDCWEYNSTAGTFLLIENGSNCK